MTVPTRCICSCRYPSACRLATAFADGANRYSLSRSVLGRGVDTDHRRVDDGGLGHQRVGGPDLRSHPEQQRGDPDGEGFPRVAGVLLVGEPQQQDPGCRSPAARAC